MSTANPAATHETKETTISMRTGFAVMKDAPTRAEVMNTPQLKVAPISRMNRSRAAPTAERDATDGSVNEGSEETVALNPRPPTPIRSSRLSAWVALGSEAFLGPEPAMAMGPGRSRGPSLTPWVGGIRELLESPMTPVQR